MNFCTSCGSKVELRIPEGDDKPRYVCSKCKTIHYSNPKMVVGALVEYEGNLLMCRRAIEPQYGKWTLPAGYLENGESVAQCAIRETQEEAGAEIVGLNPYLLLSLPSVNLLYFMFRARLKGQSFHPGLESLETALISPDKIPWHDLAFGSMKETLKNYCSDLKQETFPFRNLTI